MHADIYTKGRKESISVRLSVRPFHSSRLSASFTKNSIFPILGGKKGRIPFPFLLPTRRYSLRTHARPFNSFDKSYKKNRPTRPAYPTARHLQSGCQLNTYIQEGEREKEESFFSIRPFVQPARVWLVPSPEHKSEVLYGN